MNDALDAKLGRLKAITAGFPCGEFYVFGNEDEKSVGLYSRTEGLVIPSIYDDPTNHMFLGNEISYEPARAIWNVKGDEPSGTPELLLMERPTTFPNHVQNSSQVGNDLKLVAALRNAYPGMAVRLRALEAEIRAWRDWSTFMPHSDRLTVEYTPVQRNAIRKASKATDATRRADDKRPKGGVT